MIFPDFLSQFQKDPPAPPTCKVPKSHVNPTAHFHPRNSRKSIPPIVRARPEPRIPFPKLPPVGLTFYFEIDVSPVKLHIAGKFTPKSPCACSTSIFVFCNLPKYSLNLPYALAVETKGNTQRQFKLKIAISHSLCPTLNWPPAKWAVVSISLMISAPASNSALP